MNKSVTIKDIATRLNIHHTTVSRALRNHPDVNAETKALILKTAREMRYVQNASASNLRSQQSHIIGVIVPGVQYYLFSSIISTLTKRADEAGYTVMIFQSDDDYEIEKQNVRALMQNRVAGLIVSVAAGTENFDHFDLLEKQGIPVVYFDRVHPDPSKNRILVDNFQGAYQATEYLIKQGRKDIAFLAGPKDIFTFHERLEGFTAAMKACQLPVKSERIYRSENSIRAGQRLTEQILAKGTAPDAVFCVLDLLAFGAMHVIAEKGFNVPRDIAVVGFDDHPAAEIVNPPLTTVAQPAEAMGNSAFDCLMRLIREKPDGCIVDDSLQMKLIVRQSA